VAAALQNFPGLLATLERLVVMGGNLGISRVDLNMRTDPGAANEVLESAQATHATVEMVPVQLCFQAAVTKEDVFVLSRQCHCGFLDQKPVCNLLHSMQWQAWLMPHWVNQRLESPVPPAISTKMPKATSRLASGFVPWDVIAIFQAMNILPESQNALQHPLWLTDIALTPGFMTYNLVNRTKEEDWGIKVLPELDQAKVLDQMSDLLCNGFAPAGHTLNSGGYPQLWRLGLIGEGVGVAAIIIGIRLMMRPSAHLAQWLKRSLCIRTAERPMKQF